MKRIALFVVALLLSSPASATTTWTDAATGSKSVKASCTTGTEVPTQPSGAWAVATTYAAGNSITYLGVPYVALQSSNTGHNPAETSSAWWRAVGVPVTNAFVLEITVCATTTATAYVSDGAGFDVYVWDPAVGIWALFTATPYSAPVGAAGKPCSMVQGDSPAIGIPILLRGQGVRIAVFPTAAATSDIATQPMIIWHRIMNAAGVML